MTGKPGGFVRRHPAHRPRHRPRAPLRLRRRRLRQRGRGRPRPGGAGEGDAWVVTFVSDTVHDLSECQIFAAHDLAAGPIARVRLPERIASGTHATWSSD
ncbi:carotenoid oxygenase family protein [Nannocystis pusilla]|uniref:Carotenoid oxygenase family protein n=1 Tax=Nannocystis pusilla TaxID=889268 RepID=A0A9X3F0K8_9BACT|nr:carotenoid oxygenase family protein [Nannocystis pusilla]MCY1013862.1 carotenoid oxygenase family protein [Nannocystis pusilla]